MTEFASTFLCNPYPEPVEMFILPALANDVNRSFPFVALIQCLQENSKYSDGRLYNDSWLLHSVLMLEPSGFGKEIASNTFRN